LEDELDAAASKTTDGDGYAVLERIALLLVVVVTGAAASEGGTTALALDESSES
jgi:hypothetical protein